MAEPDTCCEMLAHCQYPSVYLTAKMVVLMENKHCLQRPLKMNEGNEHIAQGFSKALKPFSAPGLEITSLTVKQLTINT